MHHHLTSHQNTQELIATLTSKGQVTIPAAVRKRLDLKKGDTVAFELAGQDKKVVLKVPKYPTIASAQIPNHCFPCWCSRITQNTQDVAGDQTHCP